MAQCLQQTGFTAYPALYSLTQMASCFVVPMWPLCFVVPMWPTCNHQGTEKFQFRVVHQDHTNPVHISRLPQYSTKNKGKSDQTGHQYGRKQSKNGI